MGGKKVFYTEIAYVWGLVLLAFGTALMERADFGCHGGRTGYLVYLKISKFAGWIYLWHGGILFSGNPVGINVCSAKKV